MVPGGGNTGDGGSTLVPRIIWMLWFDGWDAATELHNRCLESWRIYNPEWEVRAISRQELPTLLGNFMPTYEDLRRAMNPLEKFGGFWIPPAAESDLLRLLLLVLYGGVWVDSTMICRRPLDEWLPEAAASGFFAFAPESIEERLPVMSSFLASEKAHPLVASWLRLTMEHWSTPSTTRKDLGFFWVHVLFGQLVGDELAGANVSSAEPDAVESWRRVPRISGEYGVPGPHFFVKYNDTLRAAPDARLQAAIENDRETPMWKLTNHEVKLVEVGPESCYWVLLEETRQQALRYATSSGKSTLTMLSRSPTVMQKLLRQGSDVGCH